MHHLIKSMRKCLRKAISNDGGFIYYLQFVLLYCLRRVDTTPNYHLAKCHYAKYHLAKYNVHYDKCHYAKCNYAKFNYSISDCAKYVNNNVNNKQNEHCKSIS